MDYGRQAIAVAAVLGLMGLALWWLRRRGFAVATAGRRPSRRRLEVIERLALGPQHTLHLVRAGGEDLLLACSPAGCNLLEKVASRQFEDAGTRR
jgi:flagellar biosynthetic protein FliO